jgi:hypothetical protein
MQHYCIPSQSSCKEVRILSLKGRKALSNILAGGQHPMPNPSEVVPGPRLKPFLAVMLGVVAVSFAALFTRLSTAPPLAIAFYRMLFTGLLLLPCTLASSRAEFKTIGGRDLALALLSGACLALHFAVWNTSLFYTSVASSTVLVTMQLAFRVLNVTNSLFLCLNLKTL